MRVDRPITTFTSGCFDLLHPGHLHLLREARRITGATRLIVGLNSDDYIRRKKHREPARTIGERALDLIDTGLVDWIIPFDTDGPLELILREKPDFIVVGGDYTPSQIIGRKEAEAWGGKTVIVPRLPGLSTTERLAEIAKPILR